MSRRRRAIGWPPSPEPLPAPTVDNHTHLESVLQIPLPFPPPPIPALAANASAAPASAAPAVAAPAVAAPASAAPAPVAPASAAPAPVGFPAVLGVDHPENSRELVGGRDVVGGRGAAVDGVATEGDGAVLRRQLGAARGVGVTRMVQVGCDLDAAAWTDRVVREHADLLGAVAIHPNEAVLHAGIREVAPDGLEPDPRPRHTVPLDEAIARIAALAGANDRIRAVGETGLDFFRAGPRGREVQREAFRAHIALAKELGLALQIHDRDAHGEVVETLLADGAPERTVFHCFSADAELARLVVGHGWYCSFAGTVSFPANEDLRAAVREVPPSLLLAETDAPYLTVHPFRGRPNAPYLLPDTVRAIAVATGRDLAEVCEGLAATAAVVYGTW